jgi:hypothetical protein
MIRRDGSREQQLRILRQSGSFGQPSAAACGAWRFSFKNFVLN